MAQLVLTPLAMTSLAAAAFDAHYPDSRPFRDSLSRHDYSPVPRLIRIENDLGISHNQIPNSLSPILSRYSLIPIGYLF